MIPHEEPPPIPALLTRLRREYTQRDLDESDAPSNPWPLFSQWLFDAVDAQIVEPNAMILATASPDGRPCVRTVLLKNFDEKGLVFFSNYRSRKGQELAANPQASILFLWKELERQVRFDGTVRKVSAEESDIYFQSRPHAARIGALASPQSERIPNRAYLEDAYARLAKLYENADIPRPVHWGGYRLHVDTIEFWQGRPNRLHDRLVFTTTGDRWTRHRLAP